MIGLHSYIIDLSSDGKWANEQRQMDAPGYNENIIHTFMNGLPFKPCNTTLYRQLRERQSQDGFTARIAAPILSLTESHFDANIMIHWNMSILGW